MQVFWASSTPLTVHQVLEQMSGRAVAYTTVITVLERLRSKGWLERERRGRSFEYHAERQASDYAAGLMTEALAEVDDRSAALLNFAGTLTEQEATDLRRALEAHGGSS